MEIAILLFMFVVSALVVLLITGVNAMALTVQDLQAAIGQNTASLAALEAKVDLLQPATDLTNEVAAVAANDAKINELTTKVTAITG